MLPTMRIPLRPEEALATLEAAGIAVRLADDGIIAYYPGRLVSRREVGRILSCSAAALAQRDGGVEIAFGKLRRAS